MSEDVTTQEPEAEEETFLEKAIDAVKSIFSGDLSIKEIIENIADEGTDFSAGEVADFIEDKFSGSEYGTAAGQGVLMGFVKDFYPRLTDENKAEVLKELGLSA